MTAVIENAEELEINEWKTLNTAASPNKLPAGHSPNNQNVWTDEKPGSVVTSNGYRFLGRLPSDLPVTGLINFFKSGTGVSQVVCSDGQNIWWTTDYVNYTVITTGLSQYFQLRGKVIRDKLWLTNGSDPVMTWDGTTLVELDGTGPLPNVPKGKFIEYHDERVWMYGIDGDLSALRFTALTDTSGTEIAPDNDVAWPTDNELQISEGDADIGTGIFLYRGYLYCSKQYSIWRIVGYDEYTYTRVKTRASTGTRFQESIQIKDNLVHFIGVDGLYVFDGEEAKRISDIIDPASSDAGVFAFRNLQQPLLNNQFWNVSSTADFNAGADPANLSTLNDQLTHIPADESSSDFQNAGVLTNIDVLTEPGFIKLSHSGSGQSDLNLALGQAATITYPNGGTVIGSPSFLTDGNLSDVAGMFSIGTIAVNLASSSVTTARIILRSLQVESGNTLFFFRDGTLVTPISVSGAPYTINGNGSVTITDAITNPIGPTRDTTFNFTAFTASQITLRTGASAGLGTSQVRMTEFQVFSTAYESTGTFASRTLDYGTDPATFGTLAASITTNGEAYQFFTQSSIDGSTWNAAANVANGGTITSAIARYLRWGVILNSSTGVSTPVVDKVFVGSTYISEVHDTGGNIFQWSPLQADVNKAGQTVDFYYRAAATSIIIGAQPWTAIVPGAIPAADVTDQVIQIKIEMSTVDATQAPDVRSFTVNWILDSGSGINTLQNVASIIILNRYWLSAATLGADANDIIIVLGKSTFASPFMKKDFQFLSFCRFQDYYIAGSSLDGAIYRLESGFSKNGAAMDSYYETADLSKDDFQMKGYEILVTADRTGPYNLNVGWSTDGGITWTEKLMDLTRESGDSLSYTMKFNVSFMTDAIRFRVRILGADQPFSVDAIRIYYRPITQRGTLISGS